MPTIIFNKINPQNITLATVIPGSILFLNIYYFLQGYTGKGIFIVTIKKMVHFSGKPDVIQSLLYVSFDLIVVWSLGNICLLFGSCILDRLFFRSTTGYPYERLLALRLDKKTKRNTSIEENLIWFDISDIIFVKFKIVLSYSIGLLTCIGIFIYFVYGESYSRSILILAGVIAIIRGFYILRQRLYKIFVESLEPEHKEFLEKKLKNDTDYWAEIWDEYIEPIKIKDFTEAYILSTMPSKVLIAINSNVLIAMDSKIKENIKIKIVLFVFMDGIILLTLLIVAVPYLIVKIITQMVQINIFSEYESRRFFQCFKQTFKVVEKADKKILIEKEFKSNTFWMCYYHLLKKGGEVSQEIKRHQRYCYFNRSIASAFFLSSIFMIAILIFDDDINCELIPEYRIVGSIYYCLFIAFTYRYDFVNINNFTKSVFLAFMLSSIETNDDQSPNISTEKE